jgi:hypothetical protein
MGLLSYKLTGVILDLFQHLAIKEIPKQVREDSVVYSSTPPTSCVPLQESPLQ